MGASNPLTGGIEEDHEINRKTAKNLISDAKYEASQRRRVADQLMGEQIAATGTNGIELSGSILDVVKQDRADAELEAMNIIYSGKRNAKELMRRSANQKRQAYTGLAMQGITMAASSGMFSGGGAATTKAVSVTSSLSSRANLKNGEMIA